MKIKFLNYLSAGVIALSLTACTELEEADYNQTIDYSVLPTVTTGGSSDVINSAAILSLTVAAKDSTTAAIDEVGVIIDTDSTLNPMEGQTFVFNVNETGTATGVVSGLTPGTTYYYRAYASTKSGVALGDIKTFTTSKEQYELAPVYVADFSDPSTLAGFSTFGLISDGVNTAPGTGWVAVPDGLGLVPGQVYYLGSSCLYDLEHLLDPATEQVSLGYDADNVITTAVDITGKTMPSVSISLIDIDGSLLGMGMPGRVTVYASSSPINSFDDLAEATEIGKYAFTAGGNPSAEATFNIPPEFYGQTCYFAIRNTSVYESGDLGVLVYGFQVQSYQQQAQ